MITIGIQQSIIKLIEYKKSIISFVYTTHTFQQ